jgi:hypothetical protein
MCLTFIFTKDLSTAPSGSSIQSLNVLQTVWLLKQHPDLLQAVGEIEDPTMDNLRAAGMIPTLLVPLKDGDLTKGTDEEST